MTRRKVAESKSEDINHILLNLKKKKKVGLCYKVGKEQVPFNYVIYYKRKKLEINDS